jgi:hypothetical protein
VSHGFVPRLDIDETSSLPATISSSMASCAHVNSHGWLTSDPDVHADAYPLNCFLGGRPEASISFPSCIPGRLYTVFRLHRTQPILFAPRVQYLTRCQDDEAGLNVCLTCFNGGCAGDRDHASLHFKRLGHPLALNIKRTRKKVQVGSTTICISRFTQSMIDYVSVMNRLKKSQSSR